MSEEDVNESEAVEEMEEEVEETPVPEPEPAPEAPAQGGPRSRVRNLSYR